MALSKEERKNAFTIALEITRAYGPGGATKFLPSEVLQELYTTIKGIKEDINGTKDKDE
jgi:hypothetical protein